ncbi:MAG: TMEM14 family protein [Thermoanaerobaculia bacterium]
MPQAAALATLVYGGLVLLGGLIGYLKAKSRPSLILGGLFGLALVASGLAGLEGWGRAPQAGAALAGFLLLFFGLRFLRKKKLLPAGMLAALSLAALLVNVAAIIASTPPP